MNVFQRIKILFGSQPPPNSSVAQDIEHINQEMYKKSAELAERNKTLSLLQQLNAIVLGSLTHLNEIAQLVTSLLVKDANFDSAFIFLLDNKAKTLLRLAFSETSKTVQIPYLTSIPLAQIENVIVQAVDEKTKKFVSTPENVIISSSEFVKPEVQQTVSHVKSTLVLPLIVRNDVIGALVIMLNEAEQSLSEYRRDLILRLADTIGIALDNALLYNEVRDANERLKQLDLLKDEFVSVASHELRTPMTAIKSYLWMALDGRGGPVTDKQKFYLNRAYGSVDRLIRLVNDMLNVSRIDSGRVTVELKAVALDTLTQEVVDEVMPRAQELSLTFKINPVPDLPKVLADSDKIKEVLFNLIGNAMKFTPKGGTITVSFVQKDGFIETTVADTGTGIKQEDLQKLFQKFSMVEESFASDKSIQGSGLGLYISKSIVELHKGRIWATSDGQDKGTQFTFSLKVYHEGDLPPVTQPVNKDKQTVGIIHTEI